MVGKKVGSDFDPDWETGHSYATAVQVGVGVTNNCKDGDLLPDGDMAKQLEKGKAKLGSLEKFAALSGGKDATAQRNIGFVASVCKEVADKKAKKVAKSASRVAYDLRSLTDVLVLIVLSMVL
eukprot:TRINITY_DN12417_c0_g1_i2.p1 TRINITY_DN12417_c0_g1~~TRINITY_DN12417_c0_g1_i2.p1  ORF type:complete len:123 (-),score=24.62 TRINITY_DN12417_c0_g1_i2:136-504(-)